MTMIKGDTNIEASWQSTSLIKQLHTSFGNNSIFLKSALFSFIIFLVFSNVFAVDAPLTDVDSMLKDANDFFKLAKYEEAISYYDRILELEPNHVEALGKKGDALAFLKNFDQAIVFYDKVIKINSKQADDMGRPYIDKLLEIDPQNVGALSKKGESLAIYYNKLDEAISYFDKVLEIDPNNVNASYNKGEAFFQLDKFEDAITWYDKSLQKDPNHVGSLSSKGYALAKIGNFEQSNFYLDKAIKIAPDNADVLYKKGSSMIVQKNPNEALSYFYEALKIDPNHYMSEIKLKVVAAGIRYKPLDGFVEAIVHDSAGNLVAHLKVRDLIYLDHKIVDKIIDEWPVIKTVNRNGQDYEVHQFVGNYVVDKRYLYGGASHYGIYFPNYDSGFGLMHTTYWQYEVEKGDVVTLIRTAFRPIN